MAGWSSMYSLLLVGEKEGREAEASEPDVTETLRSVLGSRGGVSKLSAFATQKLFLPILHWLWFFPMPMTLFFVLVLYF